MEEYTLLRVRLTPKGGRNALTKWEDEVLHARVSAPPVDGAANKALLELLSDTLDMPKSRITLQSGAASREKIFRLEGVSPALLHERIANALAG